MNLYHHLVETLKFARGQRWRLWDPQSHPEVQVRSPGREESCRPCPSAPHAGRDLASFQPEVVEALAMPLGDYTLYSPPPPAGGMLLSFVLNKDQRGEGAASRD